MRSQQQDNASSTLQKCDDTPAIKDMDFIVKYKDYSASSQVSTISELASEEYLPTLLSVKINRGEGTVAMCILTELSKYLVAVGLDNTMSAEQMMLTSQLIMEECPHLPMRSIKTFFRKCMAGAYGEHYNKMDCSKILTWIRKFQTEYFNNVDDASYAKHMDAKAIKTKQSVADMLQEESLPFTLKDESEKIAKEMELKRERNKIISDVRKEVIFKNQNLFKEMPFADAEAKINQEIQSRLFDKGIFVEE